MIYGLGLGKGTIKLVPLLCLNTTMISTPEELTKETILKYVDERKIYEQVLGHEAELYQLIKSPLRQDKNPSFNLYINKYNGRIWFKDLGTGKSGDCFRLIEMLYGYSYHETLLYIDDLFNLNIAKGESFINNKPNQFPSRISKPKRRSLIQIKHKPFNQYDLTTWKQWNITLKYLKYFQVFHARYVWINGYRVDRLSYTENNPTYAYLFGKRFKIYKPKEKDKQWKWRSNCSKEDIQGWKQLPEKGNHLIITKSYKDVIMHRTIGLPSIAPNGEGYSIPYNKVADIKRRFKNIHIIYDNDTTGIENAKVIAEKYDLPYSYIPKEYNEKDPCEFVETYGIKKYKKLLLDFNIIS